MRAIVLIFMLVNFVLEGVSQDTSKFMWRGRQLSYSAWRDSLRLTYYKYCDSLRKVEKRDLKK
jgi:hypothetical protein